MDSTTVTYIHLKDQSLYGRSDWFFGSVAAAYGKMNRQMLGITKNALLEHFREHGGRYENERCLIIRGNLIRNASKRKNGNFREP